MSRPDRAVRPTPQIRMSRRWAGVLGVLVVLTLSPAIAGPAGAADVRGLERAQEEPQGTAPTTLPELPGDAGRIISRPNSGQAPDDPGDPGGWQQTMLLLLVMGAIGLIGFLAWRESKRKRARTS